VLYVETFVCDLCHWHFYVCQAVSLVAISAGEMGMALLFGTIMAKLEKCCTLFHEGFMDDTIFNETFQSAVDGNFVGGRIGERFCDLLLCYRARRFY
jgi:hypothetical protein